MISLNPFGSKSANGDGAGTEADDTLTRFICWAIAPNTPPPTVSLRDLLRLRDPTPGCQIPLGRLVSVTAARLGVILPAGSTVGVEALQLAAALAMRHHEKWGLEFIKTVAPISTRTPHWHTGILARHGLVSALLRWDKEGAVLEAALRRSPLTALISRVPAQDEASARRVILNMLEDRTWRGFVQRALAAPCTDLARQNLLTAILRTVYGEGTNDSDVFVIGVYETALVFHKAEVDRITLWARTELENADKAQQHDLDLAEALARWWEPFETLCRVKRKKIEALRSVGPTKYESGLSLYAQYKRVGGVRSR